VLAVALAGAGYFLNSGPSGSPQTASGQLTALEQQLTNLENLQADGQTASTALLASFGEIAEKTNQLADQLDTNPELKPELEPLIDRQQEIREEIKALSESEEVLAQVRQNLEEAQEKVVAVLVTESREATGTPAAAAAQPTRAAETATPTTSTTSRPEASGTKQPEETTTSREAPAATLSPPKRPDDLKADQVLTQFDPTDRFMADQGKKWNRVMTKTMEFVIESSWEIESGVVEDGVFLLDGAYNIVRVPYGDTHDKGNDIRLLVKVNSGEIIALIKGERVVLRAEGPEGELIDTIDLVELAGDLGPELFHFASSLEFTD
jgi:hypothetical protein